MPNKKHAKNGVPDSWGPGDRHLRAGLAPLQHFVVDLGQQVFVARANDQAIRAEIVFAAAQRYIFARTLTLGWPKQRSVKIAEQLRNRNFGAGDLRFGTICVLRHVDAVVLLPFRALLILMNRLLCCCCCCCCCYWCRSCRYRIRFSSYSETRFFTNKRVLL